MASPTAVTPYRKTRIRFDVAEQVQVEPPFAITRAGTEIRIDQVPGAEPSEHVSMLAMGAWHLTPLQETLHYVHERTDHQDAVVTKADFQTAPIVKEMKRWRKNADLTGVDYAPEVAETGDPFMSKSVPAGQSWAQGLDDDLAAYGQPTQPTANAPLKRLGVSVLEFKPDQATYHRFITPGTLAHAPDVFCTKYFGGPATETGGGQYACSYYGDGMMALFERISGTWDFTGFTWRFCEPHRVAGASHSIRIWPIRAVDLSGGFIEFRASVTDRPAGGNLVSRYIPAPSNPRSGLFRVKFVQSDHREHVTAEGKLRFDERVDQRCHHQFTVLRFPQTGRLVDQPFATGFYTSRRSNLVLSWVSDLPTGTSLSGKLFDAETNTELEMVVETDFTRTYKPTHGKSHYYASFDFESDGARELTPYLWSYSVTRDGVQEIIDNGEWTGKGVRYSMSGAERDPSHETASVSIRDVKNELPLLRVRSMIPTIIETQWDAANPALKSYLFRGYSSRADGLKKGTAGRLYPSPEWRDYEATFVGAWARLHEMLSFVRFPYDHDPSAAPIGTGGAPPYKVSDLVRIMLSWCGYPADQIDVPDNPIRFFKAPGSDEKLMIQPLANVSEFVTAALRDYLGWHLVFDANAGADGMWRAKAPPSAPYSNLAAFQTTDAGSGKIVHRPESYGSAGWVGEEITAFIRKGTFRSYVKPPEANCVFVAGASDGTDDGTSHKIVTQWAANPKSYNFFAEENGDPIQSADPAHPDYLGRMVPIIVLDGSLMGQAAVDWVCRRVYDLSCHAIKMVSFEAPLVLVIDPDDELQERPRPLRFYDPIFINGSQFLVRSCNPGFTKDHVQMATYECQAPTV